nr:40S ribosomal protein S15a-1 [Ipomoea batatas]
MLKGLRKSCAAHSTLELDLTAYHSCMCMPQSLSMSLMNHDSLAGNWKVETGNCSWLGNILNVAAIVLRVSVLNDALKSMYNAEKRGKRQVMIRPSSKVIVKFLLVMQKHGYIGEFEYVDDHRAGKIVVELNGRLNKCGVISPRFDIGVKDIEGWTARLLPSRQFGYIVLTTSAGIMDHEEARRKNAGGKVLGFFY